MDQFTLTNLRIIQDDKILFPATLTITRGLIVYTGPQDEAPHIEPEQVIDASGWTAAPGFIDLQINGAFGFDFTRQPETIPQVANRLPETGTTAFLATFITSPLEEYPHKLEETLFAMQTRKGSRVLGAHVEGPFLSLDRGGAHDKSLFCHADAKALQFMRPLEAIRLLTLAPEQPHGLEAIRWLMERSIVASCGHTSATESQALEAVQAGSTYVTHLFNAMNPLHHRDPGLVGAALTSDSFVCGLIADGIHVHPRLVKLAWKALGAKGISLVTDAIEAMGMPFGSYYVGGNHVVSDATGVHMADDTLAGSALRMDEAVRNMIAFSGCTLEDAVRMASTTPAEVLGLDKRLGHIKRGYQADIILLDTANHVQATIVEGHLVFATPEAKQRLGVLDS